MSLILNIDSSTTVCSASISQNGKLIALKEEDGSYVHAEKLGVFVLELFELSGYSLNQIDAVAVSKGPGSYTGLRIGVSLAKGLCYGLNRPLIGVETLKSMAIGAVKKHYDKDAYYLPMIDARRMEVYAAIYNSEMETVRKVDADIIHEESYKEFSANKKVIYFGNGAAKCKLNFQDNPNMIYLDGIQTSSSYLSELSFALYQNNEFEDVAYFEPYYLKDFVAGKKKLNKSIQ